MALLRIEHTPETIKVCTPLYLILPEPGKMSGTPLRDRTVLYLLHGLSDDASAWVRYSSIETIANQYGLVVVMPSVGRSFYADQPNGQAYFTYLVEELPQYLADVFALRPPRERTLIAGLSMGGYGAFKAAFRFPQRFRAAASFSGALSLAILTAIPDDPRQDEFRHIFGDLAQLPGTEHDPLVWLADAAVDPMALPDLTVACGRQDDLYPVNQLFAAACRSHHIPLDYIEEDGRHDWYFWDRHIKRFLHKVLGDPPEE